MIKHINFITDIKSINENKLIVNNVVGSDDSLDRHGDRINPKGWDLENFKKNPVIMLNHNYEQFPIGKAINVKRKNNQLIFDVQFSKTLEVARQAFNLVKEGIMRAWSVGFMPLEFSKAGSDYTIDKMELLELSLVGIPANPNALNNSQKSLISKFENLMKSKEIKEVETPEKENKAENEANKEVVIDKETEKTEEKEEVKEISKELEVYINNLIDEKLKVFKSEIQNSLISNFESDEQKAEDPQVLLLNSLRGELQNLNKETGKTLKAFNLLLNSKGKNG
jgi:uncharacterized protein